MALLGLRKLVYEKRKHFHGMIFRKPSVLLQSLTIHCAKEEDTNQSSLERLFYIPQDCDIAATEHEEECEHYLITDDDRKYFKETFEELPNL